MAKTFSSQLNKLWKNTTYCEKIFYFFTIFIVIYLLTNLPYKNLNNLENMDIMNSNNSKFNSLHGNNIYDDFYANIYDDLVLNNHKNAFEIALIENDLKPKSNSNFLDIGSGTGHHVAALHNLNYQAQGLDISQSMINRAKLNYPDCSFKQGDALKSITFPQNSFTHILCLYFTIYLFKNKRLFLQNCYNWLKPTGYLVIHLVNKNKFDPILPVADVLTKMDPQKFSNKRLTSSSAVFKDMEYQADFKLNKEIGYFSESFNKRKGGKNIRKNLHKFYMASQKDIISLAQAAGFIVVSQSEMKDIQYYNQYIYVLQKPY
tara:strand:- start:6076 stop:7029 length:954 start_codon:yes stop_codon:yes gene_type:complete